MYIKNISIDKLIKSYKRTKSLLKTGIEFNISKNTVKKKLNMAGISTKQLKYIHNKDFFAQDTPESFYWAGFIAADGCVRIRKYVKELVLDLSIKDLEHLKKFKCAIEFDGKIHEHIAKLNNKEYGACRIAITATRSNIIEDLARFNIVPRKSLIYTFPKWLINHSLVNHFMRGYFDGDGCVTIKKPSPSDKNRKIKKLCLSIRGTTDFLETFNRIIIRKCNVKDNRKIYNYDYDKIGDLRYGGNRISVKILNFLYRDSCKNTRLDRKYARFNTFASKLPENFNFKPIMAINKKTGKVFKFDAIKLAAEELILIPQSITRCLTGIRKSYAGFIWEYIR